ncbi:uncharacterized protein LOC125945441 [Dermacentor silvarum]|uniref:uncharacterized protein LOC125945441 n=1 Tax=Dermacentor silvarum TaxID=543639 RepID=UPI002101315F|nr:uncharacterized protein LOC125945441 [Dermacentor silvarum]
MSEHSRKRPKSAQGQKAGAQNADPAAAEPVSTKPGASASHPQAGSLPGAERSPFRTMKSPVLKGPGSKGPGSKGPGSKGPGSKGPSAKGLGVDVPGVNVPGSKSPMFSVTSHGATSDKAAWSTVAACGTLAILSPSLMSPGSAESPKALIQEPAVDIPEIMRFPPLLVLSPEEQARRDERWRRRTRLNLVFFVLASVGGLAVLAALWMWLPQLVLVIWPPTSNAPMGNFSRWAVVTIKECAGVPRRVFAQSGTIGDAAVALTLCTCVALPIHCGLGGGVMALYYNNGASTGVEGDSSPVSLSRNRHRRRGRREKRAVPETADALRIGAFVSAMKGRPPPTANHHENWQSSRLVRLTLTLASVLVHRQCI